MCPWCSYELKDTTKYEKVNFLSENGDSIFSPEHEIDNKDFGKRKGQKFLSAENLYNIVENILRLKEN